MIALVAAAALVVVVLVAAWSRRAAARADRRSVRTYGRALGVLGDVSSRSDSHVAVQRPAVEEVARPHVRPSQDKDGRMPRRRGAAPAARVRLEPPVPPGREAEPPTTVVPSLEQTPGVGTLSEQAKLVARQRAINATAPQDAAPAPVVRVPRVPPGGAPPARRTAASSAPRGASRPVPASDEAVAGHEGAQQAAEAQTEVHAAVTSAPPGDTRPILFDDALEPTETPGRPRRDMRHLAPGHAETMRRAATAAAAVVVVGALAVGGYEIANNGSAGPHQAPPATTVASQHKDRAGAPPAHLVAPSSTQAPALLRPSAQAGSLITYKVPASTYTLSLSAGAAGPCWVGVQPAGGSTYLWMDTLAPGATTTYRATGAIDLRIGNPRVLAAAVNGVKVALPTGRTVVYDVSFVPTSGT